LENNNISVKQYFENADAFMVAIRSDGVINDINKKGCEILGYPKDEIVGKNWFDTFLSKETREETRKLFLNMLTGTLRHVHYEHSVISKNGQKRVFNWHNILVSNGKGKTTGTLSSGAEVTDRKAAEKKMKEAEGRLRISLDSMLEGCQIIDYDWRYVYLNKAAAEQGQRSKKELLGRTMMAAYPGIDRTEMFSHLRNCMTNRIAHKMENEFTFPNGSKAWFELHIEPVPEGILILSLDITKTKEIEAEIDRYRSRLEAVIAERTSECAKTNEKLFREIYEHKRTEEQLKLKAIILDNVKDAIFLVNSKGAFMYANEAASKTYGYKLDDFLSMNLRDLWQGKEAKKIDSILEEVIEKGQIDFKTVHLRSDNTEMLVQSNFSLIKTQHGQFIVSAIRHISEEL
jgi:PAS domain S-box-containing protein